MAVTSQMDVVNLAIRYMALGDALVSLDEDDLTAERMKAAYATSLDEMLAEHSWNFATRVAGLVPLHDFTPFHDGEWDWEYAYARPNDCVMVLKLGMKHGDRILFHDQPFRIGQANDGAPAIICRHEKAVAQYITRSVPVVQMPPAFVNAFAWLLAANVTLAQRSDPGMAQSALQAYGVALEKAKGSDVAEMKAVPRTHGSWLKARRYG